MKKTDSKALNFFKRNAVYIILALCILAIGLSATFYFLNEDKTNGGTVIDNNGGQLEDEQPNKDIEQPNQDTDQPIVDPSKETPVVEPDDGNTKPVSTKITFTMPVENSSSINEYNELPVFSETLKRYSAHLAIDFIAPENTNVMAVYDGTVEKVDSSMLYGTTITINHGNGLKTIYGSLLDGEQVNVGQRVSQGQVIGQVSSSSRVEGKMGSHLHFQVEENGAIINPDKYMTFAEK